MPSDAYLRDHADLFRNCYQLAQSTCVAGHVAHMYTRAIEEGSCWLAKGVPVLVPRYYCRSNRGPGPYSIIPQIWGIFTKEPLSVNYDS